MSSFDLFCGPFYLSHISERGPWRGGPRDHPSYNLTCWILYNPHIFFSWILDTFQALNKFCCLKKQIKNKSPLKRANPSDMAVCLRKAEAKYQLNNYTYPAQDERLWPLHGWQFDGASSFCSRPCPLLSQRLRLQRGKMKCIFSGEAPAEWEGGSDFSA